MRVALGALFLFGWAGLVCAAGVTLKISAVNPLDTAQTKEVRANLPPGIGPDDVLNADGLEVRYDVGQAMYYVVQTLELAPKSRVDFRVELRDVWVIPDETIAVLREQASALAEMLAGTEYAETGATLRDGMLAALAEAEADQRKHALAAGARPVDHIRAHQLNEARLKDVRNRLARLENLVLATGRDPGPLLGEDARAPAPDPSATPDPEAFGEALIRVTVRNTSPTLPRRIDVRHALPMEIAAADVLDADGLDVTTDVDSRTTYVYRDGLELAPGDIQTFNVKIRDRWNVNRPRGARLKTKAIDLRERVEAAGAFESVAALLDEAVADLEAIEQAPVPDVLNDRYVAFFRQQRERLDAIERRLHRVESALRPVQPAARLGFEAKPPDQKTTWRIIWIILGFLGTMSLLFFVRWYGRSKAERMDDVG